MQVWQLIIQKALEMPTPENNAGLATTQKRFKGKFSSNHSVQFYNFPLSHSYLFIIIWSVPELPSGQFELSLTDCLHQD